MIKKAWLIQLEFQKYKVMGHGLTEFNAFIGSIIDKDNLNINETEPGCSTGSNWFGESDPYQSISPVCGWHISNVRSASKNDYEKTIKQAQKAFLEFRKIPAPKRGELVRQFGEKLREKKEWLDIPVVVITAKDLTKEDHSRLKGNVEAIMQKGSYNKDELLSEVGNRIKKLKEKG